MIVVTLLSLAIQIQQTEAFTPSITRTRNNKPLVQQSTTQQLFSVKESNNDPNVESLSNTKESSKRRTLVMNSLAAILTTTAAIGVANVPIAHALVKGNAPPPKLSAGDKPKCTNVEECQAQAELREQQLREQAAAESVPILSTSAGTRYRDYEIGNDNSPTVKDGDTVEVYYKVLKLGKRSYDGISGEGTVVFSCGYGLEDDETIARKKTFTTTVGSIYNIAALNDAIVGMRVGGIRRFSIRPDQGWRKPGKACDGGPGGSGTGGELRTDYVVVPTATMVETEKCFDTTKQPYPSTYAQQRRMAQRFDQSLIMELEVVKIVPP
jgi:FKBP-type peptidyl-prolyl cis-trans isomerase